ncbi:SDR family oxidoreductase [Aquipuribacter nitratireducens]|uniref:SDR family oxidoreductase n=1 Tax=Aquipuribacter nitratireducens TaxID=650104 RepID=A0ABW0GMM2_9MICO
MTIDPTTPPTGTVLVTGGASGLGAAVAAAVEKAGRRPVVLDRQPPPDRSLAWHEVDLADPEAAVAAVDAVAAEAGEAGVTGVVTAAGTDACGRLEDLDVATWARVVAVNLVGTAAVAKAAVPHLRRTRGRLVTVASTLGLKGVSDATAYCASKFGVVGFSRALATELAGEVGVTMLVPGGMRTAFFDGRTEQYRPGPDADLLDPAEVADAVVYALSRPAGVELRELVLVSSGEPSWP